MGLLQVERLQRDADPYTSYAMASLTSTIAAAVPVLLQKVCKWTATAPGLLLLLHKRICISNGR